MMAVAGRSTGQVMTCEAVRASLPGLMRFAIEASAREGLDEDTAQAVRLAIEEACVNVIDHAYAQGEPGPITVSIRSEAARVVIQISDRATRFAPDEAPAPDLGAGWESRPIGGLGWHLIMAVMDEVSHEYEPGAGNRLTLVKHLHN